MPSFFSELRRRNVYKVAIAYAVIAWLLIQIASILFPTFEAPSWVMKVFVTVVAAGFPIALVIAWAFEMTPQGLKRTANIPVDAQLPYWSRRKFTTLIVAVALIAATLLTYQLLRPPHAPAPGAAQLANGKSIAVLPFASLSEDKANSYFADGIQDEILTRLAKIGELKVISRTSTQQYQSNPGNLAEIAKQLGVAHILEGSVQKSGESVRVNVQLIKADTDSHLWAETYDRKLIDVFAVESEVAQRIADSLQAKLTGREKEAINYAGTKSPAAYDAYLRGIALRNSQSREEQDRLIAYCRQAVALDPNFAAAWADIAVAEGLKFIQGEQTDAQKALVKQAAENALRLDPDHGNGQAAMAMYLYYCLQDYDHALIELQKAREQAPSNPHAVLSVGLVKRRQAKHAESLDLLLQAAQLDPLNQDVWVNIAWSYRGMRKFADARAMLDRALAIAPKDPFITARKAESFIAEGNLEAAERLLADVTQPFDSLGYGDQIKVLAFRRKFDEGIAKITADLGQAQSPSPLTVAHAHLALGEFHFAAGRAAAAQPFFLQAERELSALREQGNNGPECLGALLQAHALLGRRQEVEREAAEHIGRLAKDRWAGPRTEEDAARAYLILGDHDRALSMIERLLTEPFADALTPAYLRLDPLWDAVRSNAQFQQLAGVKP